MYQFYYADKNKTIDRKQCEKSIRDIFEVQAVRPTMWEEHCLECAAPTCFDTCVHYKARSDGRCMRFENGLAAYEDARACCGQGVHVQFRKWANMMTIIFPAMLSEKEYASLFHKNQQLGQKIGKIVNSKLPRSVRWTGIRTLEYARRKELRELSGLDNKPDAFLFHGYSYMNQTYNLIVEIYDDHTSVFKTSLTMEPGENMYVIPVTQLSAECWKDDNLVKVYPENDIEAALDILWCDFVKGRSLGEEKSAEKVKCVAWDLDNTLWDGILIETEDANTLQLREGVRELIKQLDERGIIQSIASKNNYEEAWAVVERLGISEYFLYPQIHWNAKSDSIKTIAENLNIGIDAVALIDDSAFERNQVTSTYSCVRCYDANEISELLQKPEFDVVVTEESKNRRAMYQAEAQRKEIQNSDSGNLIEFLKKCNLRISVFEPTTEEEKMRCFELITRTNQLNMTGKKYTADEFETVLSREHHTNFAFSCADDFGEYGIVGYGQYKVERETLMFTEFAMSCRVAGKYVESALFKSILLNNLCHLGEFNVTKTKKNELLRKTLESLGFVIVSESKNQISYSFSLCLENDDLVEVIFHS